MHWDFHILRRWFVLPENFRAQLMAEGKTGKDYLQEGDPRSGLEFCAMHSAMISELRERFAPDTDRCYTDRDPVGGAPTVDPETARETDPACDYRYTLDGWNSDEKLLATITSIYGETSAHANRFRTAVEQLSNFEQFEAIADPQGWTTEDAWCLALQTTMRLTTIGERVIGDEPSPRSYGRMQLPWAGIHNALHGMFSAGTAGAPDDDERIDVGDPAVNLKNRLFWGIHGWVEAKYREARRAFYADPNASLAERREHGTAGACGDAPGVLWSAELDDLLVHGEDRPEVRATLEEACGEEYVEHVLTWRNHIHLYESPRGLVDDESATRQLRAAGFFTEGPTGPEFPEIGSLYEHPSVP
jgi:hypothetical protein